MNKISVFSFSGSKFDLRSRVLNVSAVECARQSVSKMTFYNRSALYVIRFWKNTFRASRQLTGRIIPVEFD